VAQRRGGGIRRLSERLLKSKQQTPQKTVKIRGKKGRRDKTYLLAEKKDILVKKPRGAKRKDENLPMKGGKPV